MRADGSNRAALGRLRESKPTAIADCPIFHEVETHAWAAHSAANAIPPSATDADSEAIMVAEPPSWGKHQRVHAAGVWIAKTANRHATGPTARIASRGTARRRRSPNRCIRSVPPTMVATALPLTLQP